MSSTIRFLFGSSGVGKSTRLYQMFKFFRSLENPEHLVVKDEYIGYVFPSYDLHMVGKEYTKKSSFQGLDAFIGKLGNFEAQYNSLYRYCESNPGNLVVESVLSMSTNRTGPQYILDNEFKVNYNSEFFVYPSFQHFQKRVAERGGKVYEKEEDAKIWLKNSGYIRKFEVFTEEITDPNRFILSKFEYDDDKNNFTRRFLESSGQGDLLPFFEDFVKIDANEKKPFQRKLF